MGQIERMKGAVRGMEREVEVVKGEKGEREVENR